MTYLTKFNENLKKWDCMKNEKATRQDYIDCKDNYNFEFGKNAHIKNYNDFIVYCVDNWQ